MMFERELAEAILLDHYRSPHHKGRCQQPSATGETCNPLCGDEIAITLRVEEGKVACACFEGQGCAVSQAGTSLVLDLVDGEPVSAAIDRLQAVVKGLSGDEVLQDLGPAAALFSVRENPARVVCAGLAAELLLRLL